VTRRLALALVVLVVLFGAFVLSPYRVEYATAESEHTPIDAGDAYLVGPASDPGPGDLVVYWSPIEKRFGVAAVVDLTEGGYVTSTAVERRPAANASGAAGATSGDTTGRDATAVRSNASAGPSDAPGPEAGAWDGERPEHAGRLVVARSLVVGEVVTVGGRPAVVPGLGPAISLLRTYDAVALAFLLGAVAAYLVWNRRRSTAARSRERVFRLRDAFRPLLAFALVASLAVTPLAATTHQLTYRVDVDGSPAGPGSTMVMAGESEGGDRDGDVRTVGLHRPAPTGLSYVVRSDAVTVVDTRVNASGLFVSLRPPADPAAVAVGERRVRVYPYLPWLPSWLLTALHDRHPVLAVIATACVTVLPLVVLGLLLDLRRAFPPRTGSSARNRSER